MNEKNRMIFRVVAGGYLTYLGVDLLKNTISGKTDNPIMFGGFGAAFLIIGAGYVLYSLKRYRDSKKAEECPEEEIDCLDDQKDDEEE